MVPFAQTDNPTLAMTAHKQTNESINDIQLPTFKNTRTFAIYIPYSWGVGSHKSFSLFDVASQLDASGCDNEFGNDVLRSGRKQPRNALYQQVYNEIEITQHAELTVTGYFLPWFPGVGPAPWRIGETHVRLQSTVKNKAVSVFSQHLTPLAAQKRNRNDRTSSFWGITSERCSSESLWGHFPSRDFTTHTQPRPLVKCFQDEELQRALLLMREALAWHCGFSSPRKFAFIWRRKRYEN